MHLKVEDALRRWSKSPPAVKRRHLNFSYNKMGSVSVSESSSLFKEDVKPTAENVPQGIPNQSEADPAHQEFLAGIMMDEPSVKNLAHRDEVGTYPSLWSLTDY